MTIIIAISKTTVALDNITDVNTLTFFSISPSNSRNKNYILKKFSIFFHCNLKIFLVYLIYKLSYLALSFSIIFY